MQIKNSVVIVTGASAGIGRATAVSLAQRGANVVLNARRAERLQELAAALAAYPGRRLVVPGDIGQPATAETLVAETLATFGRVDVLINNAGVGHNSPLTAIPPADMRTILDVNVLGLLYATQAVVPHMRRQGYGQIVNVSSIISQRPEVRSGMYTASKTAVNFVSRSLRMELRPAHITVTLVYPGLTATEFADAKLGKSGGNRLGLRGVPSERVAERILTAITANQTEVYITWYDWLFTHLNRLFPRITDRLYSWIIRFVTTS
ncbi:MAG: SDR family NAD(P)-dependent oxidoreductase [Anaerolineales bacterium]|nr:SDR family NAD(P)-dependent oxidoreductase [Anaerolineales bacterium]